MPNLQMPLSGSVTQTINPWNWFIPVMGNQLGLININMGKSSNPALEQRILDEVGSYGRQLGRMGEALEVLLNHVKLENLSADERKTVNTFLYQQAEVANLKARAT